MKNLLIGVGMFVMVGLFSSCQKCRECRVITESNYDAAERKCNGYANSFPNDYVELSNAITEVCGKSPGITLRQSQEVCEGVTATTRVRYSCE